MDPNDESEEDATLKPEDLIGINYLVLDMLPAEYNSRIKAMKADEKPTKDYTDIGGLDKQIKELVEAIVLPMTYADRFKNLGIKPPKDELDTIGTKYFDSGKSGYREIQRAMLELLNQLDGFSSDERIKSSRG
ncbi:8560_t:CDS:2 [Dentiscutata erythropus]|uniref:8560_t:CDS:1 n=1 Tax=Dentiscutata erythropus TaxID=1348616 RepID=A0A9N9CGA9_9GLOM|nr:8560_t:CDS:2 [Dentiscutata erythropus]